MVFQECPVELKATIDRWNKRWPGDRDGRDRVWDSHGDFHGDFMDWTRKTVIFLMKKFYLAYALFTIIGEL